MEKIGEGIGWWAAGGVSGGGGGDEVAGDATGRNADDRSRGG